MDLRSWPKRILSDDFIVVWKYIQGEEIMTTQSLFNLVEKSITRTKGWKVDKFKLEIRHKFLSESVIKHWKKTRELEGFLFPNVLR